MKRKLMSREDMLQIVSLALMGNTIKEICNMTGFKYPNVRHALNRRKIEYKKEEMGAWNRKYSDEFVRQVYAYYTGHTISQVAQYFQIEYGQAIGIVESRFRRHGITKDKKVKDKWTVKELFFLLQNSKFKQRDQINKELKRGCTFNGVKDKLGQLGVGARFCNGLTFELASKIFQNTVIPFYYTGHKRRRTVCLWIDLFNLAKKNQKKISEIIYISLRAMNKFQHFVFQTDNNDIIIDFVSKVSTRGARMAAAIEVSNNNKQLSENFNTKNIVSSLENLMNKVTQEKCTPETVTAACNCAARITDILRVHLEVERLKRRTSL